MHTVKGASAGEDGAVDERAAVKEVLAKPRAVVACLPGAVQPHCFSRVIAGFDFMLRSTTEHRVIKVGPDEGCSEGGRMVQVYGNLRISA